MARHRPLLAWASALCFLAAAAQPASANADLFSDAECAAGNDVRVTWQFYDDPTDPIGLPQWVGYDVLRRSATACGEFVRVNAATIPRGSGATQSLEYVDATTVDGASYHYRVIPVDAGHVEVSLPGVYLSNESWQGCPETSTPALRGTVVADFGWAIFLAPCAGSCYPGAYVESNNPLVAELRAFLGTDTTLDFFGDIVCGTVEGCAMMLTSYAPSACGATPSRATSWGTLKSTYR